MDIIELYQDFSVDFLTEGHKHCRPGWVNTECPFCSGNPGYHLGFQISTEHFVCWRCGWHPVVPAVAALINQSEKETYHILKRYGSLIPKIIKEPVLKSIKPHKFPSNVIPLLSHHKQYLTERDFDPAYLEKEWNLLSTGPVSKLDESDYKNRILIPYIWDNKQVSWDTRIPKNLAPHKERYKACPLERELMPRKDILYGKQSKWKNKCILVEGPTDVWRFGVNSCAVSGIKYTPKQCRLISKLFTRVAICFDNEPQATIQGNKLVAELKFRNVDAFLIKIDGDPGGMEQSEANYLVKQLIK